MVLRVHGMDEVGVRFPVGPLLRGEIFYRAYSLVAEHLICNEEAAIRFRLGPQKILINTPVNFKRLICYN